MLRHSCDAANDFLDALALRGVPLSHHTLQLLQLLRRHGAKEMNAALLEALGKGAIGAPAVAHILDQRTRRKKAPPPLDVVLPDDPRVRDLRVVPHSLADYDRLLNDNDDDTTTE